MKDGLERIFTFMSVFILFLSSHWKRPLVWVAFFGCGAEPACEILLGENLRTSDSWWFGIKTKLKLRPYETSQGESLLDWIYSLRVSTLFDKGKDFNDKTELL